MKIAAAVWFWLIGLALTSQLVNADKDDSYYIAGTGNPNVEYTMYWKDAENVLQDLSKFSSLHVQFHHCAWTWMQYADEGNDVDENDYWYLGKIPPMGANVAFSLYGSLKGKSFEGCTKNTFINSFYTNTGFTDFTSAMKSAGMSGFSSSSYSAECQGGYGVGCDYSNGFAVHTYKSDECDPDNYSGVKDNMSSMNTALKNVQCTQIYNGNGYSSNALQLLSYSHSCFYQDVFSPDGECPDPYGLLATYQKNFYNGIQESRNKDPYHVSQRRAAYEQQTKQGRVHSYFGLGMAILAVVLFIHDLLSPRPESYDIGKEQPSQDFYRKDCDETEASVDTEYYVSPISNPGMTYTGPIPPPCLKTHGRSRSTDSNSYVRFSDDYHSGDETSTAPSSSKTLTDEETGTEYTSAECTPAEYNSPSQYPLLSEEMTHEETTISEYTPSQYAPEEYIAPSNYPSPSEVMEHEAAAAAAESPIVFESVQQKAPDTMELCSPPSDDVEMIDSEEPKAPETMELTDNEDQKAQDTMDLYSSPSEDIEMIHTHDPRSLETTISLEIPTSPSLKSSPSLTEVHSFKSNTNQTEYPDVQETLSLPELPSLKSSPSLTESPSIKDDLSFASMDEQTQVSKFLAYATPFVARGDKLWADDIIAIRKEAGRLGVQPKFVQHFLQEYICNDTDLMDAANEDIPGIGNTLSRDSTTPPSIPEVTVRSMRDDESVLSEAQSVVSESTRSEQQKLLKFIAFATPYVVAGNGLSEERIGAIREYGESIELGEEFIEQYLREYSGVKTEEKQEAEEVEEVQDTYEGAEETQSPAEDSGIEAIPTLVAPTDEMTESPTALDNVIESQIEDIPPILDQVPEPPTEDVAIPTTDDNAMIEDTSGTVETAPEDVSSNDASWESVSAGEETTDAVISDGVAIEADQGESRGETASLPGSGDDSTDELDLSALSSPF